jgi:hypothetical protein
MSFNKRNNKNRCSVRIVPYYIDKTNDTPKISIMLGLDAKYHEWTPFGGTCTETKDACHRHSTNELKQCLSRELNEESKALISLDESIDFVNCRYIHYVTKLHWANIHNNIYFAEWIKKESGNKVISKFKDVNHDKELLKKLSKHEEKSFFEMSDISFVEINDKEFGEYLYNTLQHIHENIADYKKDKTFYKQIMFVMGGLLNFYKRKEIGNTDGKRFDPYFIVGFIQAIDDYMMLRNGFTKIKDVIEGVKMYIQRNKGCSIK